MMQCKSLDQLSENEILARDILTDDIRVILPKGAILKIEYISKLQELGIEKVYVESDNDIKEEIVILQDEVETNIKDKVKDILERHTYHHNEELQKLSEEADHVIGVIVSEEEVIEQVYDIKERNADIYEHSLTLCTLCVLTAIKMQLPQNVVHDIGVGSLLHDIGLRYLSIEYQNQNLSELSEEDLIEYKKHPVYGYHALKDEKWISDISKTIILYHHERLDGTGFPLRATSLPVPVQVVNVCDAFDEMICGIGCKKVKVHEAIEYLKNFKNKSFSDKIVDMFLQFTAVYPVNTNVITNEGEIAIVVRQNKGFTDRPVLKILKDKDGNEVKGDIIKDLLKIHSLFIEKVID